MRTSSSVEEPGWNNGSLDFDGNIMGRLEKSNPVSSGGASRMKLVWSPSSSIERVPRAVVAHIRSLPFVEDLFGPRARSPSAFIRFREFSSTRAEARPSMSRNLDVSAVGMAKTSFWEWLWTRSRVRNRVGRTRARDEEKGSEACEDGPADAGSSKSKVRGFGAKK
jgi:hypothetical protein